VNRWSAPPLTFTRRKPAQAETSDGPCFSIHRIALDGATLIDPRQQQKIVQPWLGQCMDIARITKLVNIISDWYISRGYITSRAFLTEQDLRSGVLHLTILEGKLRKNHHRKGRLNVS
jgi:hemolysin activation/secretion protein